MLRESVSRQRYATHCSIKEAPDNASIYDFALWTSDLGAKLSGDLASALRRR